MLAGVPAVLCALSRTVSNQACFQPELFLLCAFTDYTGVVKGRTLYWDISCHSLGLLWVGGGIKATRDMLQG